MSWLSTREVIIAISGISIFFLLGFGSGINLGLTQNIYHSGITIAHLIAAGFAYILFAFYKRYI